MYLKHLQLKGFKSFAHKTTMEFGPGISVIVGPNGSGKSNISDAVRWVLGEQSAKSLRGSKMEDIIFSGSKERKPVGMAQVSLMLDNQDGILPLDFNEVEITRRVFRSGESDYLINKARCRLKDIHELFLDTGVGRESFSIIGQGKVEQILISKPEERRYLIEEAAGISKYRYRKEQAERKLEDTEQSIYRLKDILQEIESQLDPLKEQAEQARKYKKLKKEFDSLEIKLAVKEIKGLKERLKQINAEKEAIVLSANEQEAQYRLAEANKEEEKLLLKQMEELLSASRTNYHSLETQMERLEGSMGVQREKKSNAGKRQEQVRSELQNIDNRQTQAMKSMEELQQQKLQLDNQITVLKSNITAIENQFNEAHNVLQNDNLNNERLKNKLFDLLHSESGCRNDLARLEQKKQNTELQRKHVLSGTVTISQKTDQVTKQRQVNYEEIRKCEQNVEQTKEELNQLRHVVSDLKLELHKSKERYQSFHNNYSRTLNKLETLENLSSEYEGFYKGVKNILVGKERGIGKCQGIEGAVAQLITVPQKYELAVETALGSAVQSLVSRSSADAEAAINYLKETKGGRATFLPLDTVQPRIFNSRYDELLSMQGILSLAVDVINIGKEYKVVLKSLLGNVLLARDISSAVKAARKSGFRVKIVSLDGEVINPGGSMAGGSSSSNETGLIRREGEINRLKEQVSLIGKEMESANRKVTASEKELQANEKNILELQDELYSHRSRLQAAQDRQSVLSKEIKDLEERAVELNWQVQQLEKEEELVSDQWVELQAGLKTVENDKQDVENQLNSLGKNKEQMEDKKTSLNAELTDKKIQLATVNQEIQALIEKQSGLNDLIYDLKTTREERKAELKRLEETISDITNDLVVKAQSAKEIVLEQEMVQQKLDNFIEEKSAKEKEISRLELFIKEKRQVLEELGKDLNQKEITLTRWDTENDNRVSRLWDEYQLTFEQAAADYPSEEIVSGSGKRLRVLRRELQELGTVNLGAIEEYERIFERSNFLDKQLTDLQEARQSLNKVISEMQVIMKKRFLETFSQVNECFDEMFQRLFGGGTAALKLTSTEDVLAAGIDIVAQPPGKKLSHLSLLSGGEKALTAISLLFGILKIKPSPFCILDEIDASLDETNVDRFALILKDFSEQCQFIVVSHRQGTMESADDLYGVTMDKSGTSKLVSVKLDESQVS